MLRITGTPRRVVCFWGHATVKVRTLGWFAATSFAANVIAALLLAR